MMSENRRRRVPRTAFKPGQSGDPRLVVRLTRDQCPGPKLCLGCFQPVETNAWAVSLSGPQAARDGVYGHLYLCDACAGAGPDVIRAYFVTARGMYQACVRVLKGVEDAPIEIMPVAETQAH